MRYYKERLYLKTIRILCFFPEAVALFFKLYKIFIIYMPFLRTSFKWKMIRERLVDFEVNRALYRKGKSCSHSKLYSVFVRKGPKIKNQGKRKQSVGWFTMDITSTGLIIDGRVTASESECLFLKIDGMVLRTLALTKDRNFRIRVKTEPLSLFPEESILTLEQRDGTKLVYQRSEEAYLSIPHGNNKLKEMLSKGLLLSKKGTMNTEDEESFTKKQKYLELYGQLREAFDTIIGTPLFLLYGTLLGCVREGDLIANDDDFDAGYVSLKNKPVEVKQEAQEVLLKLLDIGFSVTVNPIGRLFRVDKNTGVHLDIMPVWFEGSWNIGYGGAAVKVCKDDFIPVKKGFINSREVLIPQNAEKFLAGYYGNEWKVPDPGYSSNNKQTGQTFLKSYYNHLITPKEYLSLKKRTEILRLNKPEMGSLKATAFINL